MTLSIIVPVYKVEPYLRRCVDSVLAQTFRDFELILVDDGSPDNCPAICDEYAEKDNRIKVIHKKNGGLSDARNVGIAAAKGEYLGFVDSDDFIHPQMYETLYRIAVSENVDIVQCGYRRINENDIHMNSWDCGSENTRIYDAKEIINNLFPNYVYSVIGYVWRRLYKRVVFQGECFPVGYLYEDMAITINLLNRCQRIAIIDAQLYSYVIRENSITNSELSLKRINDHLSEYHKIMAFYRSVGNKTQFYRAQEVLLMMYSTYRMCNKYQFNGQIDMRGITKQIIRLYPSMLTNPEICRMKKIALISLQINLRVALSIFIRFFPEWIPQDIRQQKTG